MRPAASLFAALALVSSVSAEIFITEPVRTTRCTAGVPCNVRWNDDGKAPPLKDIGPCSIVLMTGGQIQQTFLQNIQDSIDVSTNSQVTFLPEANIGPNSDQYFIRFQSLGLRSTTNPQFFYQSFSAKFALDGMAGTFNETVQAQISGAVSSATIPAGPSSSAPAGGSSSPSAPAGTTAKGTTPSASSSRSTASASSSASVSSASSLAPIAGLFTSAGTLVTAAGALIGMVALGL